MLATVNQRPREDPKTMAVQFLLFLMTILLLLIFWELSKINSGVKKALRSASPAGPPAKEAVKT
jgi:hypothetical protein